MIRFLKTLAKVLAMLALLFGMVVAGLWLRLRPDEQGRVVPLFEKIDMAALEPFAAAIGPIQDVTVFEGLPHQGWERSRFDTEVKTKDIFVSHKHSFYRAAILPSDQDAKRLHRLATNPSAFSEWVGMKRCGGYHPDWLIRWTDADGQTHEWHICFGCHETKIYGPGYQLYCDLNKGTYQSLKDILEKYHKQRPRPPKPKRPEPKNRSSSAKQ